MLQFNLVVFLFSCNCSIFTVRRCAVSLHERLLSVLNIPTQSLKKHGSLRKVEPTCTSYNDCGNNKKIARHVRFRVYNKGILRPTCVSTKLREGLQVVSHTAVTWVITGKSVARRPK